MYQIFGGKEVCTEPTNKSGTSVNAGQTWSGKEFYDKLAKDPLVCLQYKTLWCFYVLVNFAFMRCLWILMTCNLMHGIWQLLTAFMHLFLGALPSMAYSNWIAYSIAIPFMWKQFLSFLHMCSSMHTGPFSFWAVSFHLWTLLQFEMHQIFSAKS